MSTNFKIFFKDKNCEKEVLLKGNFSNFDWIKLRDTIIDKSKNIRFKRKKKELKEKDNFIIEFIEKPKELNISLNSFWNKKTFNYIYSKLEQLQNQGNKPIKFFIYKVDKLPKWDLPNYDLILQNSLENNWKIFEEDIKNKLNELELKKSKKNFTLNKSNINEKKHDGVICNSCLSIGFCGYRYMCSACKNYNLCENCFCLGNHNPEHNFILFKQKMKDDILKYNNKFNPSFATFQNIHDSFEINLKIANLGENDLKKCFITYITFKGNYLSCEKLVINESLVKNDFKEIQLRINNIKNEKGIFEGCFRMFTNNGMPFGDILKVKVINDVVN